MTRAGNEKLGNKDLTLPVAAKMEIMESTLVVLNADGYAEPAKAAEGLTVAGVAQEYADNRLGKAGDVKAWVRRGAFVLENDGTIAETDILKKCYIKDSQTVTLTPDASSVAGTILGINEDTTVVVDTMCI